MKKKDANFKKQIDKKVWMEKVTYIFERLFAFNKELVDEAKTGIENLDKDDIKDHVLKTQSWFQAEYATLLESLKDLNGVSATMTKKKIAEIKAQLKVRLVELELQATKLGLDLDKKYAWKKKWTELKKLYDSLEKKA